MAHPFRFSTIGKIFIVLVIIAGGIVSLWVSLTPIGFTEKLFALGYAFCHQNIEHTLTLGGKALPLCARCTGMYLGTLIAFLFLSTKGRAGGFPARGKMILLGLIAGFFVLDSVNSFAVSLFNLQGIYEPNNVLRLFSGLGMGLVIACSLVTLWQNTFWAESRDEASLKTWPQLIFLLVLELSAGMIILFGGSWLYNPVAIFSTFTIPVLLTIVYTLIWMMVLKKENTFRLWREGVNFIGVGLISAFIQVGLFDLLRFFATGTWAGFNF